MPTYEYRCPDGHDFEHFFRKISDATAELACPTCGAVAQRRVSGGAGLLFKGSGFYLTDYGKNAHRKGSDAGAAGGSPSESTASSKTESTKPEGAASSTKSESVSSTKGESTKSKDTTTSAPKTKGGDSK